MGTPVPAMKGVDSYFKTIGFVGLLLLGLGILLGVISYYIDFGYAVTSGTSIPGSVWVFLGLGIVVATFLLIISVLTILSGLRGRRGTFPRRMIMLILFLGVFAFILNGAANFALYSSCGSSCSFPPWGTVLDGGIVSLIAGIVLLIGVSLARGMSIQAKVVGAIFAMVFGIMATIQVHYSIFGYLIGSVGLGAPSSFYSFFNDVSSLFDPLGILDWSYFTGIAFVVVAVGLLMYAFLSKGKAVAISYIIILVGALIFAIGLVRDSISQVTAGGFWNFVSNQPNLGIVPAIAEIFFIIAGFLLLAASGLGMAAQVQGLAGPMMAGSTMSPAQPAATPMQSQGMGAVQFCPKCGTQNEASAAYCKKCGAKLG